MKNLWQNFNTFGWGLIGATLVLQPTQAQAQYIQRSFINPGFEQPVFGSAGQQCYVQVSPGIIPGWETTHGPVQAGTGNCSGYISPGTVPLIEIWTTGFNGASTATTPTSAGNQFAELNAEQNSQLYQNMCLIKDETITFSFLHRGRSSATIADVANFLIGLNTDPTPTIFGRFSTTNNGTVTIQPVAQNGATIPAVSNNNAANGWVRYQGTVPYTGASGNKPVGFAAVSTAGGNNAAGNFLDEVQFAGKAVVEFTSSSGGAAESETNPTTNPPKLRIVGLVPVGGISIPISVSGTAVQGTDYNTTSGTSTFNVTIPAGNYDGSDATSVFTIPFTVINNGIPQGVRTIIFTIQPSSSFFASSTTTCGGTPTSVSDYTIYDDDFLSGKVWNDVDNSANNTFTNINTGSETGTNAGGLLNAILVDSTNKVLKTTSVAADGTYTFLDVPLNQNNVKIILSTTAGAVGNAAPTASLPSRWVKTSPLTTAAFNTGTNISSKDFGIKQLPDVLLVKRITAINGDRTKNPNDNTPLNTFVDDTTSTRKTDDNSPNWQPNYLLGAIDAGLVLPADEIEYTVYFLNAGSANANTVRICDRLSANQDFKLDAYGTSKDVQLQLGTSTVVDLTSALDASDRTQLISAGGSVPANCYLKAANDNGTLVIDVTGNTGVPNLTTMPGSTGQGSPNDSYGFFRFVTKVKP